MNKLINIIYVQRKSFPNKVFFKKETKPTIFILSNIYHYLRAIYHFYCLRIEISRDINDTPFIYLIKRNDKNV